MISVLLRGDDKRNPVILVLPAGPGFPGIADARMLENSLKLEGEFTVATIDPRGAGKSYTPGLSSELMTLRQLVGDVKQVIEAVLPKVRQTKVHLLGFSIGGTIALLAAEKFPAQIASVTAVGPDITMPEAEAHALAFTMEQARKKNKNSALRQLVHIGPPPHVTVKAFQTRVRWVTEFGGIELHRNFRALVSRSLRGILFCPEYSLTDKIHALQGISFSQRHLLPRIADLHLLKSPGCFTMPMAIFQGEHDAAANPATAQKYFAMSTSSVSKSLVLFSKSAHNPHYDEPEKFRAALIAAIKGV
jgi:pimeloyl-ACP methyl ester carboxylesterase